MPAADPSIQNESFPSFDRSKHPDYCSAPETHPRTVARRERCVISSSAAPSKASRMAASSSPAVGAGAAAADILMMAMMEPG